MYYHDNYCLLSKKCLLRKASKIKQEKKNAKKNWSATYQIQQQSTKG